MKILYVEDNISDIELTERTILQAFPECIFHNAKTIAEAEKFIQSEEKYDLLLLDLNLPDGSGMDMLISIRQKNLQIPIIILTIEGDEEIAITALKAGADDYLMKSRNYLGKLPEAINYAILNFQKKYKNQLKIINVLYVEWHEADIEFTKRHFNKQEPCFKIFSVPNVVEALKLLPKSDEEPSEFDILLMDYRLPGINALEALKTIRQERKLSLPTVLVTGNGNEDIAVQALKLGADDYLVKNEHYLLRLPSILMNAFQKHQLEIKHKELQKSKEEYKSFFDDDLTGDFIATLDGKLLNCNPAYLSICGFSSKEEALNYDIRKLYANIEDRNALIEDLKKEGKVEAYEININRIDGKQAHVIGNMVGGFNKKGTLITLKGYIFDDTKRKIAVEKLRKLSQAVEQSPAIVLITDLKGNIEYVNKKFTDVTGYLPEEVIGKNPRIFKTGNQSKEFYENLWKTISSGQDWFGEMLNRKKDKSLYWEQASISSIKDEEGKITHFLGVKEDITAIKDNKIKLLNALEKAQESDRLKSAFLANMSHEIRTPMNGILGFAELLKEPNLSGKEQQKYIKIIEKSGERMLNIINDIVDISKIEACLMKLVIKETNINEQIEYLNAFFKPESESKGIQLFSTKSLSENEAIILSDPEKLNSILMNLIKNAIKYTDKGSIEFGYYKKGGVLEYYVKDTGIGILKDRQEAIFERFIQADIIDSQARQGAGLGLTISKAYIEMLGGKIWVESEEAKGSTFYFTIPYNVELEENNSDVNVVVDNEIESHLKKMKILIAEDDKISKLFINKAVESFSYEIINVSNGAEAVEAFQNNKDIDLILMDIKMPIMDGYEATSKIRQFNKEIVIIAQTAYALTGDRLKFVEAGFNDFISKPINKLELKLLIQKCIHK